MFRETFSSLCRVYLPEYEVIFGQIYPYFFQQLYRTWSILLKYHIHIRHGRNLRRRKKNKTLGKCEMKTINYVKKKL
jgi:hypothetical protein